MLGGGPVNTSTEILHNFYFQAEDGIRAFHVTGVQTCALPISFMEAIRQLRNELEPDQTLSVHVTLVPYIAAAGELKTKPTQHSVRELAALEIKPDVRSEERRVGRESRSRAAPGRCRTELQ